jgi:hypothetical protein
VSNGRNTKKRVSGFDKAAQALTKGLPDEAAQNLTSMVKEIASECGHNDSVMIRRLERRLRQAARSKNSWARQVLTTLEERRARVSEPMPSVR